MFQSFFSGASGRVLALCCSGDVDACRAHTSTQQELAWGVRHVGNLRAAGRAAQQARHTPTLSAAPPLPSDGLRSRSVGVELDESVVMMANVALVVVLITLVLRERHREPRAALPSSCPQRSSVR